MLGLTVAFVVILFVAVAGTLGYLIDKGARRYENRQKR
jgi:hypothetical protein